MNYLPPHVRIADNSYMMIEGDRYVTRGWSLPLKNVKNVDGKFFIEKFIERLNGEQLIPISRREYENDQH
jgi:hypothetical protein